MGANPGFQLTLDVMGRTCLVLGGDDEAAEKVQRLLEAGAKVTVVHPTLNETLRKLAAAGKVLHRGRLFRASDTQGVVLVINTLRTDQDLCQSLYGMANRERFLLWSMDRPEFSTVMMPALISRGHLRLAISTSGAAPALAGRIREDFDRLFDEEFWSFLEWLAALREEVRDAEPDAAHRRALLRDAISGFSVTGRLAYPKAWVDSRGKA